jgi:hypothetical protein
MEFQSADLSFVCQKTIYFSTYLFKFYHVNLTITAYALLSPCCAYYDAAPKLDLLNVLITHLN